MGSCLFRSDEHVNAISMPYTMHASAVIDLCSLGTITDPLFTCIQCHTWIHRLLLDSYTHHIPNVHYYFNDCETSFAFCVKIESFSVPRGQVLRVPISMHTHIFLYLHSCFCDKCYQRLLFCSSSAHEIKSCPQHCKTCKQKLTDNKVP